MQQEMQDQPRSSLGYEGEQTHNPSAYHLYGQKVLTPASGLAPTAGQRLALAIVSLSLLVFLIFGLTILAIAFHAANWAVIPIVFTFILFSVVITVINVVFNRRA
jgi:hypothetical protein